MWRGAARGERFTIALDLDDLDLRDALAEALEAHPALTLADAGATPDLRITDRDPPDDGSPALRLDAGAPGPLPAGAGPELILSAAHVLAAGLNLAAPQPAPAGAPDAAPRLSPREREVLAMLVDGAPNKGIARALGISVRTAKFHVAAVLGKLGARNRAEAVALALREGLVAL